MHVIHVVSEERVLYMACYMHMSNAVAENRLAPQRKSLISNAFKKRKIEQM